MLYALRTRFDLAPGSAETADGTGRADRFLQWLYEELPTRATLGDDVVPPEWLGNRYTEPEVIFELVSYYRDAFSATADRLRIAAAAEQLPEALRPDPAAAPVPRFVLRRVYGAAELLNLGDPTKKTTHPC